VRRETKNQEEPRPQSSSSVWVLPVHGFGSGSTYFLFEGSSSVLFPSLIQSCGVKRVKLQEQTVNRLH